MFFFNTRINKIIGGAILVGEDFITRVKTHGFVVKIPKN